MRGPLTGAFQTPVYTVRSLQPTFLGIPTFTDTSLATALTSRLIQECDLKLHKRIRASPLGRGRDDNGYGHAAVNAVQALVIIGFY